AQRVAWRRVLERGVPDDGGVGIWTLSNANSYRKFELNQRAKLTGPTTGITPDKLDGTKTTLMESSAFPAVSKPF
ncbi:MAG: hypothetical protein ABR924_14745, partial [Terracidiphilus sp.]